MGVLFFLDGSLFFLAGSVFFLDGSCFFLDGSSFFLNRSLFFLDGSSFFLDRSLFLPRNCQNRSNVVGQWSQKWSTKVKQNVFPEMTQNGLEMVPIASWGPGNRFFNIITSFYIIKRNLCFLLFITPIPLLNFLFPLWDTRPYLSYCYTKCY